MASRENQGLQVALILFVMITVALSVFSYVTWDNMSEAETKRKEAVEKATDAERARRSTDAMVQFLKSLMGYGTITPAELSQMAETIKANSQLSADYDTIKTNFDADMLQFDEAWLIAAGGQKNYRDFAGFIMHQVSTKNVQLDEYQDDVKKAQQERDTSVARAEGAKRAAETARDVAITANNLALVKNTELDALRRNENTALQLHKTTVQGEKRADKIDYDKQVKEKDARVSRLEDLNKGLAQQNREFRNKDRTFDLPDGRVVWVTQRSRSVWINLGIADGLHRQTTFSIFDQDESNFNKITPKAKIEVTRLIDRHLAEARILEDEISNPILPGDLIYTPGWAPGQRIKFALAGMMDYDGDGKSDRNLVKNVILINGGEIVAEVTDNGDVIGGLTFDTRYLVLGTEPLAGTGDGKAVRSYGEMKTEAGEYGIEAIEVNKLLSLMGFKKEAKTEPLRRGGLRDDPYERDPDKSFRPRTPPKPGDGGAFP